nr:hybrid sensor histidine kinase/response regulator [uncultured Pseudomonas sp.]
MTLASRETAIFHEQLRLVLVGTGQSLPIGLCLSSLLLWALWHPAHALGLQLWYGLFVVNRSSLVGYARYVLKEDRFTRQATRTLRWLTLNKVLEGLLWGALVWITLENASPGGQLLLISLMAAISGNGVSLLAPILPLYLALVLPMLALVATRLWFEGGSAYSALAVACLLYIAGQFGQARITRQSIRDSIALRFENLELIAQLQGESTAASKARDEAELANLAKSRFLAAASHDLRQPIHALGLFLEVLSRTALNGNQRKVLDNANAAALASAEMLNTLLDFSRIEAGVIQPKLRDCNLQEMIYKLENELAHQADTKGLVYRSRETALWVRSDPALLELILRNLISNAIRYTDTGGILIGCRRRGEKVSVEVFDTGIGIHADQQCHVFREFYQLGNPERDRRKGLGLGLAICDGLARSLGHQLSLDSRPGRGSVFRIQAPHTDVPRPNSDSDQAWPLQLGDEPFGKRILVVDDDEAVRLGMYHLLTDWGGECWAVESLEEALRLEMPVPEVIVCDYRLRDGQRGDHVIRALRAHYRTEVAALLVTGDTAPERLREATSSGIPLLHKPVAPQALRQALGRLPLSRQAQAAVRKS